MIKRFHIVLKEGKEESHDHPSDEFHDLVHRLKSMHDEWKPPADNEVGVDYKKDLARVIDEFDCARKMEESSEKVSNKIKKLKDEGKPQKQAVAIALDMNRRGEL